MGVYLGRNAVEVYGGGVKVKPEEEKTVTASTSTIEVNPTSGKTLSKVTVNPTPSEEKTVTPSASQQTVSPSDGKVLSSVTVAGDANFTEENIKSGVTIWGKTGTMKGGFPNGTEWTLVDLSSVSIPDKGTKTPLYGNGVWVLASSYFSSDGETTGKGLYYSTDNGISWSASNIINSGSGLEVYYADGLWQAVVGESLYYSTDGMIWTQSNITYTLQAICYGGGKWIAAGGGNGIYYSTDGKSWNKSSSYTYIGCLKIEYNNKNLFVIPGYSNIFGLYYSSNGSSWSASNINGSSKTYSIKDVCYANGIWVAAGYGDSVKGLYYSINGTSWSKSSETDGISFSCVRYACGIWVAYGEQGIFYSRDGKIWTQSNITSGLFYGIHYACGIWVASCDYKTYYSDDGITWIITSNACGSRFANANGVWFSGKSKLYRSVSWELSE